MGSASVGRARRAAGEFADEVGAIRQDVELAVSEAVTNSVIHGYPSGPIGTIVLTAQTSGGDLVVVVTDDGTGLRPNIDSTGLGLGLPLIARVSEDYRIENASDGGAVITMTFTIGGDG